MKKAFTITELLVAVGLLAAVLAASTMIFHYAIEAQRTAMATAEIMRTMRAITDQLNMDFMGLRTSDAPMIIEFHGDPANVSDVNADSIVFFAAGDFQDANGMVRGPVARIYYGQSGFVPNVCPNPYSHILTKDIKDPCDTRNKILARKQVLIAPSLTVLSPTGEYDINDISKQVKDYNAVPAVGNAWISRPNVNSNDANYIPMYLAKGVDNFSIMYSSGISGGKITWLPATNTNNRLYFGLSGTAYPALIKFTFTLYDSKKILKTGRTFEHIVYIGN
jgi:hypothetical protein